MYDYKTFDPLASEDKNETERAVDHSWVMLLSGSIQVDSNNTGAINSRLVADFELPDGDPNSEKSQPLPLLVDEATNNKLQVPMNASPGLIHIQSILGRQVVDRLSHRLSINRETMGTKQQGILNHNVQNNFEKFPNVPPFVRSDIPTDFLRIPSHIALQLRNPVTKALEWKRIQDLQEGISKLEHLFSESCGSETAGGFLDFPCVITRRQSIGLGMTIGEQDRRIIVLSLLSVDGQKVIPEGSLSFTSSFHTSSPPTNIAPAQAAGLLPGDRILGLNGRLFGDGNPVQTHSESSGSSLLRIARAAIVNASDPLVLHVRRYLNEISIIRDNVSDPSVAVPSSTLFNMYHQLETRKDEKHPLVKALRDRNLLLGLDDEIFITKTLEDFEKRTSQWTIKSYYCVNAETGKLHDFPHGPNPMSRIAFRANDVKEEHTDILQAAGIHESPLLLISNDIQKNEVLEGHERCSLPRSFNSLFETKKNKESCIFIPLSGIRCALNTHIVHCFLDGDKVTYIIWVYDNETGKEWYVQRCLKDFVNFREAIGRMAPCIYKLPFPFFGWGAILRGHSRLLQPMEDTRFKQLGDFLRGISGILYTGPLFKGIIEAFRLLQSFLNCNTGLCKGSQPESPLFTETVDSFEAENDAKTRFKRHIQRYTFQLFLLPIFRRLSDNFIQETKKKANEASQLIEVNLNIDKSLKDLSLRDLQRVKAFLDQMQTLILDGCRKDFAAISRRYSVIGRFSDDQNGNIRDSILMDGLREQLEIELYVPIRSVLSKQVLNSWRNEDREIQLKIQVLRTQPQSWFKISKEHESITQWDTVSRILSQGVGGSTLPCVKLRSIIQAAKEIVRLRTWEESLRKKEIITEVSNAYPGQPSCSLGADEFLPIFIFSVVRAELERPFALCALLKSLCEQSKFIGETGYYLASFEAAIEYIREVDLTDIAVSDVERGIRFKR